MAFIASNILRRSDAESHLGTTPDNPASAAVRKRNSSHRTVRISGKQTQHILCGAGGVAPAPSTMRCFDCSYPRPTPADHGNQRRASLLLRASEQHTAARFPEHAVALQCGLTARMKIQDLSQ